jgi:hypothetical protein
MATKTESSNSRIFSMLGDTLESAAEAFEEASVTSAESAKKGENDKEGHRYGPPQSCVWRVLRRSLCRRISD